MDKVAIRKLLRKNRTAINIILILVSSALLFIPVNINDDFAYKSLIEGLISNFSAAILVSVVVFFFFNWLGIDENELNVSPNDNEKTTRDEIKELVKRNYRKIQELNIDDYECKVILHKDSFFETYFDAIANAKKGIHSLGGGFRDDCSENRALTMKLYHAIEKSLQNGVRIYRYNFLYPSNTSSFWLKKILSLKSGYQNNLKLYSNLEHDPTIETSYHSMTVVDEGLDENYVFILLNSHRHLEDRSFSVFDFHYGIVVKNNSAFANEVKEQLQDLYLLQGNRLSSLDLERRINDNINNSQNRVNTEIEYLLGQNIKLDIKKDCVESLMCDSEVYEETIVENCLYTKLVESLKTKGFVWYWAYDYDINSDDFIKEYPSARYIGKAAGMNVRITEGKGVYANELDVKVLNIEKYEKDISEKLRIFDEWGVLYALDTFDAKKLEKAKLHIGYDKQLQIKVRRETTDKLLDVNTFSFGRKNKNVEESFNQSYRHKYIRGLYQHDFPPEFKSRLHSIFDGYTLVS